jgi:hypothetical protein
MQYLFNQYQLFYFSFLNLVLNQGIYQSTSGFYTIFKKCFKTFFCFLNLKKQMQRFLKLKRLKTTLFYFC